MLLQYAFDVTALILAAASVMLFVQRKILYAVLMLVIAFAASAFIFVLLNQVLAAFLQLFVFVGGLSTYLVVAVSPEQKTANLSKMPYFAAGAIIITSALSLMVLRMPQVYLASNQNLVSAAASAFSGTYAFLLYLIIILLFSSTIGTVLLIRKQIRLV
jgi:NADH:ubiquinone oxidoreductase subunit 6 (subunit J)